MEKIQNIRTKSAFTPKKKILYELNLFYVFGHWNKYMVVVFFFFFFGTMLEISAEKKSIINRKKKYNVERCKEKNSSNTKIT